MSVASRNAFALLDDDESSRSATPAAPKETTPVAAAPTRGTQRGRGGPAARGGRYYQRGGKPTAARENQNGEAVEEGGEAPKKRFEGEGRGRGRGRGRGGERSDRGDRGRGVRRPFDRHSATGKVDSEKKVHQGWGGDDGNSELKVEAAAETDAQVESFGAVPSTEGWGPEPTSESWAPAADATTAENGAPAAEGEKPEGRQRREREPEEEDNTLTLEEYLKQQKEKELEVVPKLETRKANEGDDSIWKDAVAVTKKDEEESAYFVGKTKANATKARPKKEEKVFLEIDARFERPARGGRGGRGGDRGDRPPRGGRGGRGGRGRGANAGSNVRALDVDDQTAFPSLA
ncbi:hypothetical protein PHLCEN_2v11711 [Hermanssonia centrifuga]|uniref:Hyaluronan/mRNA-binding protein domain-containing protein n=1 Tax=Hermanssonia centrifuga TaxID=98765 RepID=A0A2R6NJF1_9APHY|nr:hypothetical protein PHLCEN_2v11711 [Hermanssonia centrifuga]